MTNTIDHGYRIGLEVGNHLVSRLIGRETRSDKTHGFVLNVRTRKVFESVAFDGCRTRDWDESELDGVCYFDVEDRTLAQWQEIERLMRQWADMKLGYDYRGIYRWLAKKPMKQNGKFYCTEEIEYAGFLAGDPLFRCEAHYISPRDFDINLRLVQRQPVLT